MRICVLGSGSKGNATFIQSGDTAILIDAGFSGIEITRRLTAIDFDVANLSAILVTHEHSDHIRGVGVLSRKYRLPVFAGTATVQAAGKALAKLHFLQEFTAGCSFTFQDLAFHPFSVSHDAADPVGFLIRDDHFSLGYCTDTGTVSRLMAHRLAGCHALILESNHDPQLLKNGPYPPSLKQRVHSNTGHLANQEAADFLIDVLHAGLQHVILAHISDTNNQPHLVERVFQETLAQRAAGQNIMTQSLPSISLALQDTIGTIITLRRE